MQEGDFHSRRRYRVVENGVRSRLRDTTVKRDSNSERAGIPRIRIPRPDPLAPDPRARGEVFRQSFDRGMRLGSETNTQIPSGPRLYYKAFVESRSCLLVFDAKGELMSKPTNAPARPEYAALIGLDWADKKHVYTLRTAAGVYRRGELVNTPEAVEAFAAGLAAEFPHQRVAVALEQSRGPVATLLGKYEHLDLYPIHPKSLKHYRQSLYPSGAKSDPTDGDLILEYFRKHPETVEPLRHDTELTRRLQFLVERRRAWVDENTRETQQLTQWLKLMFPQVLTWFDTPNCALVGALLLRWPTLTELQKASRKTLETFLAKHNYRGQERVEKLLDKIRNAVPATTDAALLAAAIPAIQTSVEVLATRRESIAKLEPAIAAAYREHPDHAIMESLPGAGEALEPRLIAALGTVRERFPDASRLACALGIAPVTESSGQQKWVHFRWSCSKFVRQTLHEWAACSLPHCEWAREHYRKQRDKGKGHHAAVRSVAFKWSRILFRCWRDRVPYDPSRHTRPPAPTAPAALLEGVEWKSCGDFKKLVCKTPPLSS
jgi:transposase